MSRVPLWLVAAAVLAGCAPGRRVERSRVLADSDPLVVRLRELPMPTQQGDRWVPEVVRLEVVEEAVRAEAHEAGRRDLSTLFAFGMAFLVGKPPAEVAAVFLDAAAEQEALEADAVTEVFRSAVPGGEERRLHVALLHMGEGPFRYDFRWTFSLRASSRLDRAVALRYELDEAAPRERVSLFRGVALIEAVPGGSIVREILVVASPVSPPFFLRGKVRGAVRSILADRWDRLAAKAVR